MFTRQFSSQLSRGIFLRRAPRALPHLGGLTAVASVRPSYSRAVPPTASVEASHVATSLSSLGLEWLSRSDGICYHNLPYGEIQDHEARNGEGLFTESGAVCIDTGKFTGRSPLDKYIVDQQPSNERIWWGDINRPMAPRLFDELYEKVTQYYQDKAPTIYVFDGYCGAHEGSRKKVRFITRKAWRHHFVTNMFIRPPREELKDFSPDFTVLSCAGLTDEDWKKHGLHSEVFVSFNIEKKVALIGGTWYGGEMKKGIFSMMHYWLPTAGCLSMHCSANIGAASGDVALFFGLSGTGKTTLSTDPHRKLIGDDEHGWDDVGIFNLEGGCYAKTSKLSRDKEPEIYDASKSFGALLENVWVDPLTREVDYFNESMTENGRVSYPIFKIPNRDDSLCGPHPSYIIFLCCDAFGVLPPISKLNAGQAMYHFISGYTAKVAGTERGIIEPVSTFSACYGAAFLTLHPMEYAKIFKQKLEDHSVDCYLVNTGWSGGPYGVGDRMSIKTTRSCLDAIFDGSIKNTTFRKDTVFGFDVPTALAGVDSELLDPKNTWADGDAYDAQYVDLAQQFADNFAKFAKDADEDYSMYGPQVTDSQK